MQGSKVLFVVDTLSDGGSERFVSTCLSMLDRARFQPRVALFCRKIEYPLPEDVPMVVLGKSRPWHVPRTVSRLARWIEEDRPDVVLSALHFPNVLTGEALRWTRGRPVWIARAASNPEKDDLGIQRLLAARVYKRADRVLAGSAGVSRALAQIYPFAEGKIRTLPNPTDFDRMDRMALDPIESSSKTRPTVLSVARLEPPKRYDLMIRAFARARAKISAELVLCGEGSLRGEIVRLVKSLGLSNDVRLVGLCKNPYAWMARSDVFLLASDYEGLPNALVESQGLGLPAVVTDCRYGPNEIIEPGITGLLVPPGDLDGLAEALVQLLSSAGQRRTFGAAARRRARKFFSATRLKKPLMEILEEACSQSVEERSGMPSAR